MNSTVSTLFVNRNAHEYLCNRACGLGIHLRSRQPRRAHQCDRQQDGSTHHGRDAEQPAVYEAVAHCVLQRVPAAHHPLLLVAATAGAFAFMATCLFYTQRHKVLSLDSAQAQCVQNERACSRRALRIVQRVPGNQSPTRLCCLLLLAVTDQPTLSDNNMQSTRGAGGSSLYGVGSQVASGPHLMHQLGIARVG